MYETKSSWIQFKWILFLMKCGLLLNNSSCIYFFVLILFNWWKHMMRIIPTHQYLTLKKHIQSRLSSSTLHVCQPCTMWSDKSDVPEFTKWPPIVSLYYYTMSDTYCFIFDSQSILLISSPKVNAKKEMIYSLYTGGLLSVTNIILAKLIIFLDFNKYSQSLSLKYWIT